MVKYLNITEARSRLTSIQRELSDGEGTIAITTHGKPSLALMSWDLYEAIMETLEIMSDPGLMAEVRRGIEDISAGRLISLKELEEEFA
jgi:prevent-host-death family protein